MVTAPPHTRTSAPRKNGLPLAACSCLRVNATATDIWPKHEVTQRDPDGGLTVRYLAGPKHGLHIHFFSAEELAALFTCSFTPVLPPRLQHTWRDPPPPGQWAQWEAIWRKTS